MILNRTKKSFLSKLFVIAIPITLQNLITSLVNLVDNVMIGRLGDEAIASVGLANQFFFIYSLLVFGICSGAAVFTAQYFGKRDYKGIRTVTGQELLLSVSTGLIFGLVAFITPMTIMRIFSPDEAVCAAGAGYLRIVAATYPLAAVSFAVSYLLKSVGEVKAPMYISALSVCINIIFNYLLIYGKFGCPELGVNGAAIATLISRVTEAVIICAVALCKIDYLRTGLKDYIAFTKENMVQFFKVAGPVIINETLWGLGMSAYSAIYSRIGDATAGTAAVAAANTASLAEKLFFVGSMGFSHAAGIIIGKNIGAKKKKQAVYAAKFSLIVTPLVALASAVMLILIIPLYTAMFNLTPAAQDMTYKMLFILALSLPLKSYTLVAIVGIMRAGGDTRYALLADILCVWFIGVPLGYISGIVIGLSAPVTYAIVVSEEVVKAVIVWHRMRGKKWLNDLVN